MCEIHKIFRNSSLFLLFFILVFRITEIQVFLWASYYRFNSLQRVFAPKHETLYQTIFQRRTRVTYLCTYLVYQGIFSLTFSLPVQNNFIITPFFPLFAYRHLCFTVRMWWTNGRNEKLGRIKITCFYMLHILMLQRTLLIYVLNSLYKEHSLMSYT